MKTDSPIPVYLREKRNPFCFFFLSLLFVSSPFLSFSSFLIHPNSSLFVPILFSFSFFNFPFSHPNSSFFVPILFFFFNFPFYHFFYFLFSSFFSFLFFFSFGSYPTGFDQKWGKLLPPPPPHPTFLHATCHLHIFSLFYSLLFSFPFISLF